MTWTCAFERSEYERFLREAPSELGDEFEIVNSRTRDDFPCTYSYLTLKNTVMIPEFYRACTYEKPISIDVFPLDVASDDPYEYKRQARKTWIWGRLMFLRATPAPYLPFDGPKKALVLTACGLAHGALKLFGAKAPWIQGKWEAAARPARANRPTGLRTSLTAALLIGPLPGRSCGTPLTCPLKTSRSSFLEPMIQSSPAVTATT